MFSTCLLLLLSAASNIESIELVQPAAMVVKPGEYFLFPVRLLDTQPQVIVLIGYDTHQGKQWNELAGFVLLGPALTRFGLAVSLLEAMFHISLFALVLSCVYCNTDHDQPSSMATRTRRSLTIPCKILGYSPSDSSKEPSWMRQAQGKTLEFIGMIHASGSTDYKDSLKMKFSISIDTSSSTVFLKGDNLQPEDTAVYYCAWYTSTVTQVTLRPATHLKWKLETNVALENLKAAFASDCVHSQIVLT
ncbi:uncharacterized protein LOC113574334 [Electrophorus electricus]|uniref:uncharacterized protein LOC113574334 n=1 Tax=Electrophorus electricus TaxID=8005 RepID=UPI0015D00CFC|nr:uncharacterized protein LOC113574334 [Electrophorus electricus]